MHWLNDALLSRHAHRAQHGITSRDAGSAGLRTNVAMLVHIGMPGALTRASAAKRDARCELRLDELPVAGFVRAGKNGTRGGTDGDAVEVEANACDQALNVAFRHARISAGSANLDTVETCIDSLANLSGMCGLDRMRPQHGSNG